MALVRIWYHLIRLNVCNMQFKVWIALNYMQFKYLNICFCWRRPLNQWLYRIYAARYFFLALSYSFSPSIIVGCKNPFRCIQFVKINFISLPTTVCVSDYFGKAVGFCWILSLSSWTSHYSLYVYVRECSLTNNRERALL